MSDEQETKIYGVYSPASGVVYYDKLLLSEKPRKKTTARWEAVRQAGIDFYSQYDLTRSLDAKIGIKISDYLRAQAQAEFEKEKAVLEDYFGTPGALRWLADDIDSSDMVKAFNEAYGLVAVCQRLAKETTEINEEGKRVAKKGVGRLTAASYFGGYFTSELKNRVIAYFSDPANAQNISAKNSKIMEADFRRIVDESFDAGMSKALGEFNEDTEFAKAYETALEMWNKANHFKSEFKIDLWSRYDMENVLQLMRTVFSTENALADVKGTMEKVLGSSHPNTKFSVGGTFDLQTTAGITAEYIAGLIAESLASNGNFTVDAFHAGRGGRADLITVLSKLKSEVDANVSLDTGRLEAILAKGSTQIEKALPAIKKFSEEVYAATADRAIIYDNIKKRNMGKHFNGFDGGERSLSGMQATLAGIGLSDANKLVDYIRQTMTGAIYQKDQEKVRKQLAGLIANFLFDDYGTIGNGVETGKLSIHLFDLDNTKVPLSFLLNNLSKAMANASSGPTSEWASVNINYNGGVAFTEPPDKRKRTSAESAARWSKQASKADGITITVTFLKNFKDLMANGLFDFI